MIEMLGVLAIIGVLSVGGIAGFRKAMMKYKSTKMAEKIYSIHSSLVNLYANEHSITDSREIENLNNILRKTKVVPKEIFYDKVPYIRGAFNNKLSIVLRHNNSNVNFIYVKSLPQETCIDLAMHD